MIWKEIQISEDNKSFIFNGKRLFDKDFKTVLKFHESGIAPVEDYSGWYHIDLYGQPIYKERYDRVFGFYYDRATVVKNGLWFHLNEVGKRVYSNDYKWCGNYQQNMCVVRDFDDLYFHINLDGNRIYKDKFLYTGDFYDGFACAKTLNGWKHIKLDGTDLNGKYFYDLGVFHKGFAVAKDKIGWFHIDKNGNEIYKERYEAIEPFYNGYALITDLNLTKKIINEKGEVILEI